MKVTVDLSNYQSKTKQKRTVIVDLSRYRRGVRVDLSGYDPNGPDELPASQRRKRVTVDLSAYRPDRISRSRAR